ncbi:unnamed protein product [Ceratitis capitata]|uniref:(Mediterranean fruit fly) hypothetical protein n=1 Tax=Ceratitis capitata TaxID=7213 RepID=A0A811UJ27_CERCA|nr:unnamed protein product [Ceratitis capitata]
MLLLLVFYCKLIIYSAHNKERCTNTSLLRVYVRVCMNVCKCVMAKCYVWLCECLCLPVCGDNHFIYSSQQTTDSPHYTLLLHTYTTPTHTHTHTHNVTL